MIKVQIYAGLYKGKGIGHLVRSATLCNFLNFEAEGFEAHLTSNQSDRSKEILSDLNIKPEFKSITNADILIVDSPEKEDAIIESFEFDWLVRLDYFHYSDQRPDLIINLFNHELYSDSPDQFNNQILVGLEYTILKEDIIQSRSIDNTTNQLQEILVTFSGEDPNDNTTKVIERFSDQHLKVICPPLRSPSDYEMFDSKIELIEPSSEFGALLNSADVIACGGGTTLLEALFFGKPIIAIGQNATENRFIEMLGKQVKLFSLDQIDLLLRDFSKIYGSLREDYIHLVDGKGKFRISEKLKQMVGE